SSDYWIFLEQLRNSHFTVGFITTQGLPGIAFSFFRVLFLLGSPTSIEVIFNDLKIKEADSNRMSLAFDDNEDYFEKDTEYIVVRMTFCFATWN
ncbi:LOW QUALITY PROTEIN: hypothetical protein M8C21_017892, partial [Ambrosia artemisiifolia]